MLLGTNDGQEGSQKKASKRSKAVRKKFMNVNKAGKSYFSLNTDLVSMKTNSKSVSTSSKGKGKHSIMSGGKTSQISEVRCSSLQYGLVQFHIV